MLVFTQCALKARRPRKELTSVRASKRLTLWIMSQLQTFGNIGNKCLRCLKMDILAVWLPVCVSIKGLVPGITKSV